MEKTWKFLLNKNSCFHEKYHSFAQRLNFQRFRVQCIFQAVDHVNGKPNIVITTNQQQHGRAELFVVFKSDDASLIVPVGRLHVI